MDVFEKLVNLIIIEQEHIVGPVALEQAQKVKGLSIDWNKHEISFQGNKTVILEQLIEKYKNLFGQASVEVCKEALSKMTEDVPKEQLPNILQS